MTTLAQLIEAQDALVAALQDGVLTPQTLSIGVDPTQYNTFVFPATRINGATYPESSDNSDRSFDEAHTVTATKYGVIVILSTNADVGEISSVASSPQAYDTAQEAIDARATPNPGTVENGYIVIHAGVADWVANTDSLAGVSTFVNADVVPALPAPLT